MKVLGRGWKFVKWNNRFCLDCHNTKRAPLVKQFFALEYEFEDCWLNKVSQRGV